MNDKELARKAFKCGKNLALYELRQKIESVFRSYKNFELDDYDLNIILGKSKNCE